MIDIPAEAIRFNLFYEGQSPIPDSDQDGRAMVAVVVPLVTEETPSFRSIFMSDFTVVNCGTAAYFQGLPEMMLEDIHLTNASFSTTKEITIIDAKTLNLKMSKLAKNKKQLWISIMELI